MTIANRADIHEALARAYDKEDAAQRGEPDQWTEDADPEWRAERLACAQVALEVALPEITQVVADQRGSHILRHAGAAWWHTDDYASPCLSKAGLGEFFFAVLSSGAQVGEVWPFNFRHRRSLVLVSIFATEDQKAEIEAKTRYRLRRPPKIKLS